jgi:hypothetical protein
MIISASKGVFAQNASGGGIFDIEQMFMQEKSSA